MSRKKEQLIHQGDVSRLAVFLSKILQILRQKFLNTLRRFLNKLLQLILLLNLPLDMVVFGKENLALFRVALVKGVKMHHIQEGCILTLL